MVNPDKFRTESFDGMGDVGVDTRWLAFGPFHDYLENAFPLVCVFPLIEFHETYGLFIKSPDTQAYQSQHLRSLL